MRLAWIRDNYMFDLNASNDKKHLYALYYDGKTKSYRAVQTTHLYVMDPKRKDALDKKHLLKMDLPGQRLPSGVRDSYFAVDVRGRKLDLKNNAFSGLSKRHLPKTLSAKIRRFATRRDDSGRKKKKTRH